SGEMGLTPPFAAASIKPPAIDHKKQNETKTPPSRPVTACRDKAPVQTLKTHNPAQALCTGGLNQFLCANISLNSSALSFSSSPSAARSFRRRPESFLRWRLAPCS